jgi:hypothetical protein
MRYWIVTFEIQLSNYDVTRSVRFPRRALEICCESVSPRSRCIRSDFSL